jgi:hypothetical protein
MMGHLAYKRRAGTAWPLPPRLPLACPAPTSLDRVLWQQHEHQHNRDAFQNPARWRRCYFAKSPPLCRPINKRPEDQDETSG